MAERILNSATWNAYDNCPNTSQPMEGIGGLPNCCQHTVVDSDNGLVVYNNTICKLLSAQWSEHSLTPGLPAEAGTYVYNTPSVEQPFAAPTLMGTSRRVTRQMHGKGQACLRADFRVVDDLVAKIPAHLRLGLLAKPNRVLPALVRFAGNKNVTLKDAHDIRIRGFGIKLDLEGSDLIREPKCHVATVPSFAQPESAQRAFMESNLNFPNEARTLDLLHVAIKPCEDQGCTPASPPYNIFVANNVTNYFNGFILGAPPLPSIESLTPTHFNPFSYTYGSASPLRLGPNGAMKMHWALCPGQNVTDTVTDYADPDYFYKNLKATIESQDVLMCGYIQLQEDPCVQLLDNPTDRWLTEAIHVFTLHFRKQTAYPYDQFCDNSVYHPYNTLVDHFPLGFINRVRMGVYASSGTFRLAINNGVQEEPNGHVNIGANLFPYGFKQPKYSPQVTPPTYEASAALMEKHEYQEAYHMVQDGVGGCPFMTRHGD